MLIRHLGFQHFLNQSSKLSICPVMSTITQFAQVIMIFQHKDSGFSSTLSGITSKIPLIPKAE